MYRKHVLQANAHNKEQASTSFNISILRTCNQIKSPDLTRQAYSNIIQERSVLSGILGDYVVLTLATCGAIDDSIAASSSLASLSVFSWTAILKACVNSGHHRQALSLYRDMLHSGIHPDHFTVISLFKACSSIPDVHAGKQLHIFASANGYASDVFVGSALVNMYGKCRAISEAEVAFVELSSRNIVSWSAMLTAYVENGHGFQGLMLYRQMQEEGVAMDSMAFMLALQACSAITEIQEVACYPEYQTNRAKALVIGQAIHADSCKRAFMSDAFLCNSIVDMYGKCGAIVDAENVFTGLRFRDIVSWNSMLFAYIQQGHGHRALQLFTQMQKEGISADELTMAFSIQACGILTSENQDHIYLGESMKKVALTIGHALHMDTCKKGFDLSAFVCSSLMKMYGKCGAVIASEVMFEMLSDHDTGSWNTMLSVYVENGDGENALLLYRQMQKEEAFATPLSVVLSLQACTLLKETGLARLEIVKALHAEASNKKFSTNALVVNALITMYGILGGVTEAEQAFCALNPFTTTSWNTMISLYIKHNQPERALQIYTQMHSERIKLDHWTYVLVLQACGALSEPESMNEIPLKIGSTLHSDADKQGFTSNIFLGSTLISMYGKCGAAIQAEAVFDSISHQTIVSWTAMLSVYVEHQPKKTLELYRLMLKHRIPLNNVTLNSVLQGCSAIGSLETCQELHFAVIANSVEQIPSVAATLIHTYGICMSMVNGQNVFDSVPSPDIVLWNACISGHSGEGNFVESLQKFERLRIIDAVPDDVTFTVILSVCGHMGLVDKALQYLDSMVNEYDLIPDLKHYTSIVDLLGRVGDFEGLEFLLSQIPNHTNLPICMSLMHACSVHGNMDLAESVFDCSVDLHPNESNTYLGSQNLC